MESLIIYGAIESKKHPDPWNPWTLFSNQIGEEPNMIMTTRFQFLIVLITLLSIKGGMSSMISKSHADPLEGLQASLPKQIMDWKVKEDNVYDDTTIFSYIDGSGEVYRAYNMRKCLSRRYTSPKGPDIVLDIFDMGSSEDAFGVFTHDRDGEPVNVGQEALYRTGWLSFWKDRFFVSVYMEEETDAAEKAVKKIGEAVASRITSQGPKPGILLLLPQEGLQGKSVRFLHHYIVLNYHFFFSNQNILNLGPDTDAVLAKYQRGDEYARLLLVEYPDIKTGAKSLNSIFRHYLPDADTSGIAMLENGKWSSTALWGKLLAFVLEADSRQLTESLLKGVKESVKP